MLPPAIYSPTLPPEVLAALTGGDPNVLAEAESHALATARAYLAPGYLTEGLPPTGTDAIPGALARALADLVAHDLYTRLDPQPVPPLRRERQAAALVWLQQAAEGRVDPGLPRRSPALPFGSNPKLSHR